MPTGVSTVLLVFAFLMLQFGETAVVEASGGAAATLAIINEILVSVYSGREE